MAESYERQTAVKLKIKEIIEGEYITEEGWKPNYLLTKTNEKVSRVNLVGVVLEQEETGSTVDLLLDDGSGKIRVRSFEEIKSGRKVKMGESALIIGKIRMFNKEKYIAPEIIKRIDKGWLKLRSLEWGKNSKETVETEAVTEEKEEVLEGKEDVILELIKKLDKGEGALTEEVVEKAKIEKAEEVIEALLEKGEVFQNLPGRVKVL